MWYVKIDKIRMSRLTKGLLIDKPRVPILNLDLLDTNEEVSDFKTILEEQLKMNIEISFYKDQIKLFNPSLRIKMANGKWRKIFDTKALNKQIADFHFKMHDSNEIKQAI
ncbi:MAG: hypothetical protein EZS28_028056 [Streblomastix strix]|uniref:Uncharacterized protein n=1 Tax=Streblomastix strix TaxID=222440 RepID=A0A5J4V0B2_9EUKA|nr:MAG: hypothetical protein EZS28_028056 [Streblomastix strix]